MPLADRIIELRKKQGWSQIDLADRLDVSRQSVSKWEMAQAVPELDKIIKMSELFAVTTDYLLKDDAPVPDDAGAAPPPPPPEEPPRPAPEPETPPGPAPAAPKKRRRRWILAAVFLFSIFAVCIYTVLSATGAVTYTSLRAKSNSAPLAESVAEGAAGSTIEQEAVSDPDAVEDGMTEYVYEGESVTSGGFDEATLAAMAAEYAPYGLTCDTENRLWYLDGQRIRAFTDVLTTNGESLTGGDFHGTLRTFSGDGFIDVRTVRDYDHCDDEGVGKLLYLESCDIRLEDAHWTEHHADEHHDEDRHG